MTEKTPVTIKIDEKEWPITLDTNDLIEVEELTGINALMGPANLMLPSFALLRGLLYVSLLKAGAFQLDGRGNKKPTYSLAEVGGFIDMENSVELRDSFIDAWGGGRTPESVG